MTRQSDGLIKQKYRQQFKPSNIFAFHSDDILGYLALIRPPKEQSKSIRIAFDKRRWIAIRKQKAPRLPPSNGVLVRAIVPYGKCCDCSDEPGMIVVRNDGHDREYCIDCAAYLLLGVKKAYVSGLTAEGRGYIDAMLEHDWFLHSLIEGWLRKW